MKQVFIKSIFLPRAVTESRSKVRMEVLSYKLYSGSSLSWSCLQQFCTGLWTWKSTTSTF